QGRATETYDAISTGIRGFGIPVKVIDIYQGLAIGGGSRFERGEIFVGEPVAARRSGAEFALPTVNAIKAIVDRAEDEDIGELVLERLGEGEGFGDIGVGGNGVGALHFQVRGVPKFRLVVELHEGVLRRGIGAEDGLAGEFLIEGPDEFVHVDVVVVGGRIEGERSGGLSAFLVDDLFEAGEVGRIGDAHRTIFVASDETLQLEGDEAGHAVGLVARDEAADGFGGRGAAAEVVVVFVEVVAASVGGVGFPVVGGPAIAAV